MYEIEEIIGFVVDEMRSVGNITSFLGNAITVDDVTDLSVNDYILIVDDTNIENAKITNIANNDITLKFAKTSDTLTNPVSYKANKPYYNFEYWLGAANDLLQKDNSILFQNQKYPLILLLLNINENRTVYDSNYSIIDNLDIYFIEKTDKKKESKWRLDNIYNPILIPLYKDFLAKLLNSYYLNFQNSKHIAHTYEKLYFMSSGDTNQNKLNDYVDTIHISIQDVKIKNLIKC